MNNAKTRSGRMAESVEPSRTPLRVLAVVEGTAQTNRILSYLTGLSVAGPTLDVVVLNVQERRTDGRLRGYETFKREEVEERVRADVGGPIVSSAARWLEKAGINATTVVEFGDPLTAILETASARHCTMIVVGAPSPNGLARWLAAEAGLLVSGSVAARLVAVSPVPVAVVR